MATKCKVYLGVNLRAIPVMLSGDALPYCAFYVKRCQTFQKAMNTLRLPPNKAENCWSILIKWQFMHFIEEMPENPDESELDVFQKVVSKIVLLKMQLGSSYHRNKFPAKSFMTTFYIPSIQAALRNRIPRVTQQLTNRIANRFSKDLELDGSDSLNDKSTFKSLQNDDALYKL